MAACWTPSMRTEMFCTPFPPRYAPKAIKPFTMHHDILVSRYLAVNEVWSMRWNELWIYYPTTIAFLTALDVHP